TQVSGPEVALRVARTIQPSPTSTVIITMGEQGLGWVATEAVWIEPPVAPVVDPAGAGDAVAAVAVFALLTGMDLHEAARLAMIAAWMTLSVDGATHPGLSLDALHARA
ncbi:MAG TPA: PfkB family carbohydrate kinase, partial [bacterium]|nr:PfkB family carbohydrate kinase [bacterium]